MNTGNNPLQVLSEAMSAAAARAGAWTVLVDARRRMPASGIALAADQVLTAEHVLEKNSAITVMLADGTRLQAEVAGRDPGSDLAVLRLDKPLATPAVPAAGEAQIGALVLALGRPHAEGIQASLGVVSARGGPLRTGRGGLLESYLRTDAIPYPGFSGGPLVNAAGEVVGLNTSGLARGASLVIPSSLAWRLAEALFKHGQVRRGFLGVRTQPVALPAVQQSILGREQAAGLLVVGLESGGPAEQSGLLVGDILVALDAQAVTDADELLTQLAGERVGETLILEVLRGGEPQELQVTIGARP